MANLDPKSIVVGARFRDNDPRANGRVLVVKSVVDGLAFCDVESAKTRRNGGIPLKYTRVLVARLCRSSAKKGFTLTTTTVPEPAVTT